MTSKLTVYVSTISTRTCISLFLLLSLHFFLFDFFVVQHILRKYSDACVESKCSSCKTEFTLRIIALRIVTLEFRVSVINKFYLYYQCGCDFCLFLQQLPHSQLCRLQGEVQSCHPCTKHIHLVIHTVCGPLCTQSRGHEYCKLMLQHIPQSSS